MSKGMDVSYYQGNINWSKVKASGVNFAILRCGYTGWGKGKKQAMDKQFIKNYNGAKANGISVGAYFFSRACTEEEGVKEAKFVLFLLKGKQFELPIYIDVEDKHYQKKTNKNDLTKAVKAFCDYLEAKGYYVGIYASKYWFDTKLDLNMLKAYDKWVAQWSNKCTLKEPYGMWQYTSKGKVKGILGNVDMDNCYKNYPKIMKANVLNGLSKAPVPKPEHKPQPKPTQPAVKPVNRKYIVKKGDSLSKIAKAYGISLDTIEKTNPQIKNKNLIYVGQEINIPTENYVETVKPIKVGSIVKVKRGARTYDNKPIASFVFNNKYRVDELEGNRAVLNKKRICTPVNTRDLEVVQSER